MSKMSNKQKKLAALAYIAEGNSFFEVKDFMGAIESYDKALEIKPFHSIPCYAYLNKGGVFLLLAKIAINEQNLLLAKKELAEAISCYSKTIEYDPSFINAQKLLEHCQDLDTTINVDIVGSD